MKPALSGILLILSLTFFSREACAQRPTSIITGRIVSVEGEIINFASVYLKDTNYGGNTNRDGIYHFRAPSGLYTLVVSAIGYETVEIDARVVTGRKRVNDVTLNPKSTEMEEVVVSVSGISRVRRSPFNAVAIDTKALQNTTRNLSDALAQAPGLKLRESGGVGSDMQLMLDGYSGRHVKIFIDGVPQEGVGNSFGLNNIPVNYAERIEVYKGVVPVGYGTDAIGGVINIVTRKDMRRRDRWFLDASYSYGSFNTHKSYVNFGRTFKSGYLYEINAFQNYSDNSYHIDTIVEEFREDGSTAINKNKTYRVKRFHDTYHNEAIVGKAGIVGRKWADRLLLGFTYSRMHKDIQNGVRQDIVYGDKYREGYSLMPSLEYGKRDLLTKGLDLMLTANYNRNINDNVDTGRYHYNWFGERKLLTGPGEQSYQNTRSYNDNWNGTATLNYRLGNAHTFTFNHVTNSFSRNNKSRLTGNSTGNSIDKVTRKNISGLSYTLKPSARWNVSVFGKYYNQYTSGPVAETSSQTSFVRTSRSVSTTGYGAAGTYFIITGLQAKLSYEKAHRLPTEEEMFGDEDLESGQVGLKPERSDNLNFVLSYEQIFGSHSLYLEGGLIYRDTRDYIQRKITDLSGGKSGATYENHGKVRTQGYNISIRYGFSKWLSVGGTFTRMDVKDNVKTVSGGTAQENLTYKARIPNIPYQFANSDLTFYWNDLGRSGNVLSITYDNLYMHSFPLRSEVLGSKDSKSYVPRQFAHNISVSYSMRNGRYNVSFECRNLTDEKLYDNYSLQKAGRAFYGKFRIALGN